MMTPEEQGWLDDDAAVPYLSVHEMPAALTVVLVTEVPGSSHVVPLEGGDPIALDDPCVALDQVTAMRLLGSAVTVDASDEMPPTLLAALRQEAVPPLFRASPWLRRARVLILRGGEVTLAGARVGYRPGRGLWVDPAEFRSD